MVFQGTSRVYESIYCFNSKWAAKKEKYANSKWLLRNLFCCCRGTQWICSSKYLFLMQIFCWLGDVEEIIVLGRKVLLGKKIIQGVRGDLKSRIAATGYLYGLLTTQDQWIVPYETSQWVRLQVVRLLAGNSSISLAGSEEQIIFFQQSPKIVSENFGTLCFLGLFLKISRWVPLLLF